MACDKSTELQPRDYQVLHIMLERGRKLLRQGALTISQKTISEWCNCSVRCLQDSLDRLIPAGLIGKLHNYRAGKGRGHRAACSYYFLKENPFHFMVWCAKVAARKPRKPHPSKAIHATACLTKTVQYTNPYKNKLGTAEIDCGQDYWQAIMGLPDR